MMIFAHSLCPFRQYLNGCHRIPAHCQVQCNESFEMISNHVRNSKSQLSLLLQEEFLNLLQFGYIHFKILIALKLLLYRYDIFSIPNLPLMRLLKVLLELIQLASQNLPLVLDFVKLASDINCIPESVLLDDGLSFGGVQVNDELAGVGVGDAATTHSTTTARALGSPSRS